jgi:hypothetical protein
VPFDVTTLDQRRRAGARIVIMTLTRLVTRKLAPVTSIPLSILYETVDDGWVQARIEELPAVITAAPTRTEARVLVLDALREYLLSLRDTPVTPSEGDREAVALEIAS